MVDPIVAAGKFLADELKVIIPEVIPVELPEYWGYTGEYIPSPATLPLGLKKSSITRIQHTGKAVNWGGRATSIPLVNFGYETDEYKTLMGVLGAEWDWFELQTQAVANANRLMQPERNVVSEYMYALEQGLREWMHLKTIFGDTAMNFAGLLNSPYVEIVDISTDLYALTSNQLAEFFRAELKEFRKDSLLIPRNIDLLVNADLEDALYAQFTSTTETSGSNSYEYLTNQVKGAKVRSIVTVNELQAYYLETYGVFAPNTNKDMFVLYELSADVLDRPFAPIRRTVPQLLDDGLTYRVTGFCGLSEVRVKRPNRVRYYTYPKFRG